LFLTVRNLTKESIRAGGTAFLNRKSRMINDLPDFGLLRVTELVTDSLNLL
jgi:hypothetical protein